MSNDWIHIILSVNYDVRLTCSGLETFRLNILLISAGCIYILASSIILYNFQLHNSPFTTNHRLFLVLFQNLLNNPRHCRNAAFFVGPPTIRVCRYSFIRSLPTSATAGPVVSARRTSPRRLGERSSTMQQQFVRYHTGKCHPIGHGVPIHLSRAHKNRQFRRWNSLKNISTNHFIYGKMKNAKCYDHAVVLAHIETPISTVELPDKLYPPTILCRVKCPMIRPQRHRPLF